MTERYLYYLSHLVRSTSKLKRKYRLSIVYPSCILIKFVGKSCDIVNIVILSLADHFINIIPSDLSVLLIYITWTNLLTSEVCHFLLLTSVSILKPWNFVKAKRPVKFGNVECCLID